MIHLDAYLLLIALSADARSSDRRHLCQASYLPLNVPTSNPYSCSNSGDHRKGVMTERRGIDEPTMPVSRSKLICCSNLEMQSGRNIDLDLASGDDCGECEIYYYQADFSATSSQPRLGQSHLTYLGSRGSLLPISIFYLNNFPSRKPY
jgi:hypothetical protein